MVVLSQPASLDHHLPLLKTCKLPPPPPTATPTSTIDIPVVDLSDRESAPICIANACEEFGFFKVINHGVRPELMTRLEDEAVKFFALPQGSKDKAGPPDPFGYGSKRIGPNGDVGWIEYILLNANPQVCSVKTEAVFLENPGIFRSAVEEYMAAIRALACSVLDMVADGLGIAPRDTLSRLVRNERSDSCLRLNHYPEASTDKDEDKTLSMKLTSSGGVVNHHLKVGFGEHTDPQIISVLRSNNTSGLQICLRDGSWAAVPPDQTSFFINVGDALQVMTNGRLRSVKHRVVADTKRSRVSMIYFGGPPLTEKIAPLPCLVPNEEDRLYKEFTWSEYKSSAYKTRLGDYRLGPFEKNTLPTTTVAAVAAAATTTPPHAVCGGGGGVHQ